MSISNKLLPKAFAENAGSTYRYDIPDTNDTEFTNKATYDKGFPAVTMTDIAAGGIPPFGQDMNGVLCDLTTAIRYLQAGNLARYDSSFATAIGGYLKNAVVSDLDANQYRSLKDNNTAELTDTASWVQIDALEKGIGGTVSGNTNFTGKLQNNGSDVVSKANFYDTLESVVLYPSGSATNLPTFTSGQEVSFANPFGTENVKVDVKFVVNNIVGDAPTFNAIYNSERSYCKGVLRSANKDTITISNKGDNASLWESNYPNVWGLTSPLTSASYYVIVTKLGN